MTTIVFMPEEKPEPEFIEEVEVMKCYLCDREFQDGEDSWLLFEKRIKDNGELDCALSEVVSSALGRVLDRKEAHSEYICAACNLVVSQYESIEQHFYDLKYKIVDKYNATAKANGLEMVVYATTVADEADEVSNIGEEEPIYTLVDDDELDSKYPDEEVDAKQEKVTDDLYPVAFMSTVENNLDGGNESNDIEEYFEENSGDVVEVISEDMAVDIFAAESDEHFPPSDNNSLDSQSVGASLHSSPSGQPKRKKSTLKDVICDWFSFDGTNYECLLCPEDTKITEKDSKIFSVHLKTFHNAKMHICDVCSRGFAKRTELNDHLDGYHGSSTASNFHCETCDRVFSDFRLFRYHRRSHYPTTKQFHCKECDKRFNSKNLLDEHINMHTGQRPYKCSQCPKDFASKYTLQAHSKVHMDRPRPFKCDQCPKAFYNVQNLTQHVKLHSGVKEFICEVCNKAFGTQHNLDVHSIVHTGNKPFICRTCGKAFARRAEIRDHERTHTGEKPFVCDMCPMAFAQRSNLTSHKRSTHMNDRRNSCTLCEKSFKRKRLLDYHMRSAHTGERPHKCDVCSATFVYPEHYKKHMLIHSGHKPYVCSVCNKAFNSRDNRNAHLFTHSTKKPYECYTCHKGFMRKPQLYNHMQTYNHVHDLIVINQPRIPKEGSEEESSTAGADEAGELIMDQIAVASSVDGSETTERTTGDLFVTENGDVIKNENMDDEDGDTYVLQFAHKDEDGKETVTWVDMRSEMPSL